MTDLIKSVSIEGLVIARERALARVQDALDALNEASAIASKHGLGDKSDWLESRFNTYKSPIAENSIALVTEQVDRSGWRYLMRESGLETFMDSKERAKWRENLDDSQAKIPVLTVKNIVSTFKAIHDKRGRYFIDGITVLFKSLSWDYQTNVPCKFGKRIIINNMVSHHRRLGFSMSYHNGKDTLDDLDRVFRLLDGKSEVDSRMSLYYEFQGAVSGDEVREHSTEYFHFRWFMKGTVHITFKRLDLVDQVNAIIADEFPGCLPARV